jgi:hypothetical protein
MWLSRVLDRYRFRSFQRDIQNVQNRLTREQEDALLSELYQNNAFHKHVLSRENAIILAQANTIKKPSDEEYLELHGRRKENMELFYRARVAYKRNQERFVKKKEALTSPQASA